MSPDLVVIGAGAVGLSTALYAQMAGMEVTVVERVHPGAGASSHNGGIFSLGNCLPTSTPEVIWGLPKMLLDPLSPLAIRWSYLPRLTPWLIHFLRVGTPTRIEKISQAIASLLEKSVEAYQPLLDDPSLLAPGGHIIGFADARGFDSAAHSIEIRRRRGVPFDIIDAKGVTRLDPSLAKSFHKAILVRDAPFVAEPAHLVEALAIRFRSNGGVLLVDQATGFQQRDGEVTAVLMNGGRLPTGSVVVAAGAWSKRLATALGNRVPLDTERGYGVHLPHPGVTLRLPVISWDHHLALTPTTAGGLRIVGTDELAGLEAPPDFDRARRLIETTRRLLPGLDVGDAEMWMSFRPSMPDSLPVIGKASGATNGFLAFGHGHIGFTTAAITGKLVSQLMTGVETDIDPTPFRPDRFRHRGRS